jgi:hypothetical protein
MRSSVLAHHRAGGGDRRVIFLGDENQERCTRRHRSIDELRPGFV